MAHERRGGGRPDPARGVYGISVASELSGLGAQTLRLYESHGLITPWRSEGGTRRYSGDDLARLARIAALSQAGVNLAGIGRILDLEDANTDLAGDNATLREANHRLRRDSGTEPMPDPGRA